MQKFILYFVFFPFIQLYGQHQLLQPNEFYQVYLDSNFILLDVRTGVEFELVGHIPGAISQNYLNKNKPFVQLNTHDKNRAIMIYCMSGHRSSEAVKILKDEGFTRIYELKGGLISWISGGLPVE